MPLILSAFILAAAATPRSDYFPPSFATAIVPCSTNLGDRPWVIVDDFQDRWYSKHLRAAGEPSLFTARDTLTATGMNALRFTWLPSFHHPVVVRLEWSAKRRVRMLATELGGAGGYDPAKVTRQIDRFLTPAEVAILRTAIRAANLPSQPTNDCALGCDGAQWLFEGVDARGYHFADRWSPERGELRGLGVTMLKLTGWRFKEIY